MTSRPRDEEIMGLYVWHPEAARTGGKEPAGGEVVDIIAVQGLGASPYYTWVKKVSMPNQVDKEVMWLRDLLPKHVSNARIATFSYLSDWFTYKKGVKTSIRELGGQLLTTLQHDRERIDAVRRPIIFIGHSMGGLIIKQALVLAGNRPNCEDIKQSTAGVIFLGTPHGGTDVAGYAAFIAKVKGNDSSLVESLKPTDKDLWALSIDFAAGCKEIRTVCYYEKEQKGYYSGLANIGVVEQRSAVREGQEMVYLHTDYSGLNKFSGDDDPNFRLVVSFVGAMAGEASSIVHQNYEGRSGKSDDSKADVADIKRQGLRRAKAIGVMPFPKDEDFVGREDSINLISETFTRSMSASVLRLALVGLGGIGKSQIAIEYAHRVKQSSPTTSIFWVYASNASRFESSYREIAIAAKLPGVEDPKRDVLSLVSRWLGTDESGKWLMILDNADDASIFFGPREAPVPQGNEALNYTTPLSRFLPQNARGSILITSRYRDTAFRLVGKDEWIVKIDPMGEENTTALLAKKLPHDQSDSKDRSALIKELEYIPLAITQASAYIAVSASRMTVSKYLEFFRLDDSNQMSLLNKDSGDLRRDPEVPNSVVKTFQISFDQIKDENETAAAADLLSCMCMFDRQKIPGFLFRENNSELLDFEDAVGTLTGFSFVVEEKQKDFFDMHRLVQLATRKWLQVRGKIEEYKEKALERLSYHYPIGNYENWNICEALEPHAQTILKFKYSSPRCRLRRAIILHNRSWYALSRGKYALTEALIQGAIDTKKELLHADDPDILASLGILAQTKCEQGRWKEAEEILLQVSEISKRVLGPEHPDTLIRIGNLASTYQDQGRWKEAEVLLEQVVENRKTVLGAEHPDTLTIIGNLASIYFDQGRWKEAEVLLEQVVEKRKTVLGAEHPDTLISIGNVALVYQNKGRWKEAEVLGKQVLGILKRVLGAEHPDTLTSMYNLAQTYKSEGRYHEAIQLMENVVNLRTKSIGADHPSTLNSVEYLKAWSKAYGYPSTVSTSGDEEEFNDSEPDEASNQHNEGHRSKRLRHQD